ncbi:MAG: hypothetical protein IRZ00_17480 [Gemmatimonadetes bacterium]|nr:hypothetical protein [Gemmatimonadota bacterium]
MKRATELVVAGVIGAGTPVVLGIVASFGRNVPSDDLAADYLVACLWALALGASVLFWPASAADRRALLRVWAVKVAVTLGLMLPYERHYAGLDAYSYFQQAQLSHLNSGVGLIDGTRNTLAVAWLLARPLGGSYHALKVSFSLLGLIGVYLTYRAAVLALGREDVRLLYFIALFPSVLFWSSILGKDPVALVGIGLCEYGAVGWLRRRRAGYLVPVAAGTLLAVCIRIWLGPVLLAPTLLVGLSRIRSIAARVATAAAGASILLVLARFLMQKLGMGSPGEALAAMAALAQGFAHGGSAQQLPVDISRPAGLLEFLPLGMFTALFRPLPGDVPSAFGLIAGLENLALLLLAAVAAYRARWRDLRDPVVLWVVLLLLIWSVAYAAVSYGNLGAAVRFKLQVLPALLALLLYLAHAGHGAARAREARRVHTVGRGGAREG